MWKSIRAFFTALLVLVLGYGVVDLWARRSAPALPAIPQPNGYHELLRISDEIQVPKTDGLQSNPALLRETATKNKEALERLHKTVRSEVGVPLRTTKNWVEEHDQEVKNIKRLGMALVLQGRDHLLAGRTNQAAGCALDTILLGHAMRTGGIFSDGMNGLLVETIGAGTLLSLVEGLDADFCRGAARELELMESKCEAPERILETERNWSATSFGLAHLIVSRVMAKTHTRRETEFLTRYETTTRRTRGLILSLAAQAVELETGETVTDPTALVPAVLKAVPIDPQTGKAFERVPGRSILIGDPSG